MGDCAERNRPLKRGPAVRPAAAALLLLLILAAPADALEEWGSLDLFEPHVSGTAGGAPAAALSDGSGSYGNIAAGASLAIPFSDLRVGEAAATRLRLLGHIDGSLADAEIGFLGGNRTFSTVRGGCSALYAPPGRDHFRASVGIGFSEDQTTVADPDYRLSGLFLGTRRTSPQFSFSYGISYSYLLGQGPLLPSFGIDWQPQPRWAVRALFPFTASVRYRVTERVSVGFRIRPDGYRSRVANDATFPDQADTLRLRVSGVKAGLEGQFRSRNRATLRFEAGVAAAQQLSVSDGGTELLSTRANAAPYLLLTLGFPLGSQQQNRPDAAD